MRSGIGVHLFLLLCLAFPSQAQVVLFPELEGEELQAALRTAYTPGVLLNITQAKDTLYLVIERAQDSVRGIYSGYALPLPEGVDPSQWLFETGSGINLEHVYPQSKGAGDGQPGNSDMHHLYPSRVAVNEARASFPFAEIPDLETTTWFINGTSQQSIPTSQIDRYSESRPGSFEPRESVKGNIARSVFYFYTIYQQDADAADPDFFPLQRETLCAWHLQDPADPAEIDRSVRVALYQDGKENPFVLDCTAALRAWCPEYSGCTTSTEEPVRSGQMEMIAFSEDHRIILRFSSQLPADALITVSDLSGRTLESSELMILSGTSEFILANKFPPGLYIMTCVPVAPAQKVLVTRCLVQ